MMQEKRGMSSIVATSLVITITILAGAILGTFIVPFVQKNLERSTECTDYESYFSFEAELLDPICHQTSNNNYVVVSAKNDKALEKGIQGFQLLFVKVADPSSPGGKAVSVAMRQSGASVPQLTMLGASGKNPARAPKAGEILTYVYNDGASYNRVDIAAIVGNGRVCERRSDTIKIVACGNAARRP